METKTKRIELRIAQHLVTALVNADESGLESDDIKAIDNAIELYGPYFHVHCPSETETNFERCDLTGLASDCLTCTVEVSDE